MWRVRIHETSPNGFDFSPNTGFTCPGSDCVFCIWQQSTSGSNGRPMPRSRFLGRGVLLGYKWYINERPDRDGGVANIRASPHDHVEGLCYLLSREDERRLDKCEDVRNERDRRNIYEKIHLPITVVSAAATTVGRRVREVNRYINPTGSGGPLHPSQNLQGSTNSSVIGCLVYIDPRNTSNGAPGPVYRGMIEKAFLDGQKLGITGGYYEMYIRRPIAILSPQ